MLSFWNSALLKAKAAIGRRTKPVVQELIDRAAVKHALRLELVAELLEVAVQQHFEIGMSSILRNIAV